MLDQVPGVVVHHHFDQHIAGEEFSPRRPAFAVLDFDDVFRGNQDLTHFIREGHLISPFQQAGLYPSFEAGISMDDVPVLPRARLRFLG